MSRTAAGLKTDLSHQHTESPLHYCYVNTLWGDKVQSVSELLTRISAAITASVLVSLAAFVFWGVASCSLIDIDQNFGAARYLHLQGDELAARCEFGINAGVSWTTQGQDRTSG